MAEREEPIEEQAAPENNNKELIWTNEMKIDVVIMDKEDSKKKGFYEESKRKMRSKVSRIPTSKLAETER